VVPGNAKCRRCLKGKKGCKFPVEEEEVLEGEEDVEEVSAVSKLPIASLKKLISSPLRSLRKGKKTDLLPELQKEKAATLFIAMRARRELLSPELLLQFIPFTLHFTFFLIHTYIISLTPGHESLIFDSFPYL
jgi:hypothetical protein